MSLPTFWNLASSLTFSIFRSSRTVSGTGSSEASTFITGGASSSERASVSDDEHPTAQNGIVARIKIRAMLLAILRSIDRLALKVES